MDDHDITTRLADLTRRLREVTGDEGATARMGIWADGGKPWTVWLHAVTVSPHGCISFDGTNAWHALEVADAYLRIDTVHRALSWLDEVKWLESSWEHPGGIPQAQYKIAEIRQDAAGWWCGEHEAEVAAERAARREAQYRAVMKGAETVFAATRRRTA